MHNSHLYMIAHMWNQLPIVTKSQILDHFSKILICARLNRALAGKWLQGQPPPPPPPLFEKKKVINIFK